MKIIMSKYKYLATALAVLGWPVLSQAQSAEVSASLFSQYQLEIVLGVAALVCVLALLALLTALYALKAVLKVSKPEAAASADAAVAGVGFWRRFWNKLNDSVPLEQEDMVLTNHEYDGIRELDNRLPPWWIYGFYATIVFAVVYMLHYHVFNTGKLQVAEYQAEMTQAKAEVETYLASLDNLIDESNVTLLEDEADLAVGKDLFISKCSACHGQQGEGGVGPNFTDKYWIHGGDMSAIFKTVKYGVPSKGMISWQSQLTPKEMQQVSSFIYLMEGTTVPNGKEPQGELFERGSAESTEPDTQEAGI